VLLTKPARTPRMNSLTASSTGRVLTTLNQFPAGRRFRDQWRRGCLVLRPSHTHRARRIVCMAVRTNPDKERQFLVKDFDFFFIFYFYFVHFGIYFLGETNGAEEFCEYCAHCCVVV